MLLLLRFELRLALNHATAVFVLRKTELCPKILKICPKSASFRQKTVVAWMRQGIAEAGP
jgi:hypothetical protein